MTEERKGSWSEKQSPELDELVRNSTHPEMQNIDPDEEFIAVNFREPNEIDQENHQGLGTST